MNSQTEKDQNQQRIIVSNNDQIATSYVGATAPDRVVGLRSQHVPSLDNYYATNRLPFPLNTGAGWLGPWQSDFRELADDEDSNSDVSVLISIPCYSSDDDGTDSQTSTYESSELFYHTDPENDGEIEDYDSNFSDPEAPFLEEETLEYQTVSNGSDYWTDNLPASLTGPGWHTDLAEYINDSDSGTPFESSDFEEDSDWDFYNPNSVANRDLIIERGTTFVASLSTAIPNFHDPYDDCFCGEPYGSLVHHPLVLPCTHVFGRACLREWVISGAPNCHRCPICRRMLFERPSYGS